MDSGSTFPSYLLTRLIVGILTQNSELSLPSSSMTQFGTTFKALPTCRPEAESISAGELVEREVVPEWYLQSVRAGHFPSHSRDAIRVVRHRRFVVIANLNSSKRPFVKRHTRHNG